MASGEPVEKLKKVVHFPVRFHENRPFERSKLLRFFLRAGAPGKLQNPGPENATREIVVKQSAWQAWKPLALASGGPVEKLKKVVHFPLEFHENRPPEQSKLLTISSEPGRPESRKIPDPKMQLAKLWSNNHPGKPGNHWPWPVVDPSKS